MRRIYLDYAATSPTKPEVLKAMLPYFSEKFGNASSIHSFGREAREAIDEARTQVAKFLHCQPEEVIFTSGGTESDNLAIKGIIENSKFEARNPKQIRNSNDQNSKRLKNSGLENLKIVSNFDIRDSNFTPHVITSAFEHHAVLDTCKDLEKRGLTEVTYVKPDREGIISVESVKKAIRPNTVLVSIMYVNNEIGTVQPIGEIAKIIQDIRHQTSDDSKKTDVYRLSSKVYFHTDAVQAIEYQPCDVKKLGVDMLSLSAHKFGGPKGVGALYIKKGTSIARQNIGGAQEFRLRAGTENVAGIVGLGEAIRLLSNKQQATSNKGKTKIQNKNMLHVTCYMLQDLRDYFIDEVTKKIPDVRLNGSKKFRNPNNINLAFKYVEGESILIHLDLAGIAASSGSACTSGSLESSHVIKAIGLSDVDAHGTIRFTLGEETTKAEIDYVLKVLPPIIKKLRSMSPFTK